MKKPHPNLDVRTLAAEILGYLNFSSGAADVKFLNNLSVLFAALDRPNAKNLPTWRRLGDFLREHLNRLHGESDAFRSIEQADAALRILFDEALPGYRAFHRDLLFHQTDVQLFQPFFIGRAAEAVLRQGGPWNESDRIVRGAIAWLNDYLGFRPVAVLHNERKIQPYEHEWVRPIPLFIQGAGAAHGPYRELVELALSILRETDPAIFFDAHFPLEQLDELAIDPRAYDFDHPVNKRPNYIFGQWDLQRLDNAGRARRFVLQQTALDGMLDRIRDRGKISLGEALFEEAAVLAGTMLMGSGVSGSRPDEHDSTVTLATLVIKIAGYRDAFYKRLLDRLKGAHGERLRKEAAALKQPFGGARQHFNHFLARRRAQQLQHVHLAVLFARMGYVEAAERQVRVLPVASARMNCGIQCRITAAHRSIDAGGLEPAVALLGEIEDLLRRGIECGALPDPWNLLGFGAQFSLFPAPENSVHDHRLDELIDAVKEIFAIYVRLEKESAARGQQALFDDVARRMGQFSDWWDQFGSTEVGSVDGCSGRESSESTAHVCAALRAWHDAGAAAGDIAFWRGRVENFTSPKAYSQVIDTLLEHRDPVAAMALLMQWLSQAEDISLIEDTYSFQELSLVWMEDLWTPQPNASPLPANLRSEHGEGPQIFPPPKGEGTPPAFTREQKWSLSRKFFDYLEANAGHYWRVPKWSLSDVDGQTATEEEASQPPPEDEEETLYGAAYEQVTYRDTTDDGMESSTFDAEEDQTESELSFEVERITDNLQFLATLAHLWKFTATVTQPGDAPPNERDEILGGWLKQAEQNYQDLMDLLTTVHRFPIPAPRGSHESMLEYDRRRSLKDMLLENVISVCIDTADSLRMIRAAMQQPAKIAVGEKWEEPVHQVLRAVLRGDAAAVRKDWPQLLTAIRPQPMLYMSLVRGGNPQRIVRTRAMHSALRRLLAYLPRLGMIHETAKLLETLQFMEIEHSLGPGSITEFDRIFAIGCKAIAHALAAASDDWAAAKKSAPPLDAEAELIALLEQTAKILLDCWLGHSRGVRLSVMETVGDEYRWDDLRRFIEKYGREIFTQQFMNLGNLRAILHEGAAAWLGSVEELDEEESSFRLFADLDRKLDREAAALMFDVIIEAVVENYGEYIDYNSITTQSDRGDMLYTLLDFLRLRANYDRVAWNLRPVLLIHEVLVRVGKDRAAESWRQAVAERTDDVAQSYLRDYQKLCKKYGMHLPSIAERIEEQFTKPLLVDQLVALVKPAMEELRENRPTTTFPRLEELVERFTRKIAGAGYETPEWLAALEDEAAQVQAPVIEEQNPDPYLTLPEVRLTLDEAKKQFKRLLRGGMTFL
ncbi:MAG: hypothetical protein IT426_20310 [Pirellulales bacterium]|nr:hypothetical protein [Pirellulales bacterium]